MDQPELQVGDGPIALICAPTRELCQQIYNEARRFGKVYNIHTVAVFGGGNKYEQSKALQEGAEIVVATPVSFIYLYFTALIPCLLMLLFTIFNIHHNLCFIERAD